MVIPFDAMDLYRGAGGWSVAATRLGIAEEGVENNKWANATATAMGFPTFVNDVWDYIKDPEFYDGLIASPPCQTFSLAGKRKGLPEMQDMIRAIRGPQSRNYSSLVEFRDASKDERTAHVLVPLYVARITIPHWIALEQVPTVMPMWEAIADELREIGYDVWTGIMNAERYGVPQTRRRAVLIASLVGEVNEPKATHSRFYTRDPKRLDPDVLPWISMAEALGWGMAERPYPTVAPGTGAGGGPDPLALGGSGSRAIVSKAMEAGDWTAPVAMGDVKFAKGTVRKTVQPAPTITASADNGNYQWVFERPAVTVVGSFRPDIMAPPGWRTDPKMPRQYTPGSVHITVTDAGILQSFPEDYPWQGPMTAQFQQVGNAIPPLMAEAILKEATGG